MLSWDDYEEEETPKAPQSQTTQRAPEATPEPAPAPHPEPVAAPQDTAEDRPT